MADDGPAAPAPSTADVEAARANASANAAAEAAAAATAMAQVEAARANDDAANRIAGFEGRLNEWHGHLKSVDERLTAWQQEEQQRETRRNEQLTSLSTTLQSIQDKLAPPPAPNPPNPAHAPPADAPPAAEPEPAPAKKKAHRWI